MATPQLSSYASGTSELPLLGDTIGANLERTVARFGDREALVDRPSGRVRVTDAWAATDAGLVINPDGLSQQIEGGVIQSASWKAAMRPCRPASPMCRQTSSTVRFWAARIQCLILAKVCSIGLRSGE